MKLLDRIALHKAVTTILNFIVSLVKIFVPTSKLEEKKPVLRRRGRPRKNSNE